MELQHIKRAYVPAILLAYNGALVFASSILGADTLLKFLERANLVADDEIKSCCVPLLSVRDVRATASRLICSDSP